MGRAGSDARLMACAILNDCMVCPAQENETVVLSNWRANRGYIYLLHRRVKRTNQVGS